MTLAWSPRRLRIVSLSTALLVAIPVAPVGTGGVQLAAWLSVLAVLLGTFWLAGGAACATWSPTVARLVVSAAAGAGLALVALGHGVLAAAYPVLVAALAGSLLAGRDALLVVTSQSLLLVAAFAGTGLAWRDAALLAAVFAGLQLFVVHTAQVARAEGAARRALEETHRELQAAQERLAERSRDAERLRIARDLHDVMGHHLTALSLTLEAASHSTAGARGRHVEEALVLTKRLLRDVRQVVSALRDESPDLISGLRRLAAETRRPIVHLELRGSSATASGAAAEALLRCAQEAVTNAARHGAAGNLWLELSSDGRGLRLVARDDGGGGEVVAGHGLRGIAERLGTLGGQIRWGAADPGGFVLEAWLPASEPRR